MCRFQIRTQTATAGHLQADKDSAALQTDLETTRNQPLSIIHFWEYDNLAQKGPCYNRKMDLPHQKAAKSKFKFANWCSKHGLLVL